VLSVRGLCVGLMTHPEQSYRAWFVFDRRRSTVRKPRSTRSVQPLGGGGYFSGKRLGFSGKGLAFSGKGLGR
jgi:hypothetical protein